MKHEPFIKNRLKNLRNKPLLKGWFLRTVPIRGLLNIMYPYHLEDPGVSLQRKRQQAKVAEGEVRARP